MRTLDFEFSSAPFTSKQLMSVEGLTFGFQDRGPLLIDGLSFSVGKGDRIAVIGKNGKGKTTLLNLLAGELAPMRGTINRNPQLAMGYFGQTNIVRLSPERTVEEEIMDVHPDHSRSVARKICGVMMFEGDNALKRIDVLSGGEKSRVLLGKILVHPANLLLLDEPTNHLDMESIDSLVEAVDVFNGAVIIVTHSEMILDAIAERLVVFDGGKVFMFDGTYRDFLERVGWKDEEGEKPGKGGEVQDKGLTRKDIRRQRAEIITNRSRVLNPLQLRIAEVEESIVLLEKEVGSNNEALLDASMKGDGERVKRFSKDVHRAGERMECLFVELEALTVEYEQKSREFDEMLKKVG
jgi:ATP-binding cassette subfamily F protein 3